MIRVNICVKLIHGATNTVIFKLQDLVSNSHYVLTLLFTNQNKCLYDDKPRLLRSGIAHCRGVMGVESMITRHYLTF